MASDLSFVEYAAGQMHAAGAITFRKMFGEFALYCDGKVVALVCDNQLFVKPTAGGRKFAGRVAEAPPYPSAKPSLLIDERLDDQDWISVLIRITAAELPVPQPKQPAAKRKPSRKSSRSK